MKKGFTLIELLAVIAIMGILAVIIVPNVVKSYNTALTKKMQIDETNVKDAAELYVEDHCYNPLSGCSCPDTFKNNKYICLSELINPSICLSELINPSKGDAPNDSYIDIISYRKEQCTGFVQFGNSLDIQPKTYLYCGKQEDGTYSYKTDNNVNNKCDN